METVRNAAGWVLFSFFRLLLRMRYRVEADPRQALGQHPRQGILVLPNHPGYVDPPLVMTHIWGVLRPRPLSWAGNWANPFMAPFLWLVKAIPIPDMSKPSQDAREKMGKAIEEIVAGLKQGSNQILWPAGHLQRQGKENLAGTSGVWTILCAHPDTDLLLCRTEGLWGSRLGFGFTGQRPDFTKQGLISLGWWALSLFFFMPRRRVKMHFRLIPASEWAGKNRNQINALIEEFLNDGKPAPDPLFVPYHYLIPSLPRERPQLGGRQEFDLKQFQPKTMEEVNRIVQEKLGRPLTEAELDQSKPISELGLDSLDAADITLKVEQTFGFHADEMPQTLGGLWALAHGAAPKAPPKPAPKGWASNPGQKRIPQVEGDNLAEALTRSCLRNRSRPAVADDLSGMLTYDRLFLGSFALSRQLKAYPEDRIGLLLPASVATDVALFACFLAGKSPVLLNWTTGPANLSHCAKLAGIKRFLTSKRFLDRVHVTIDGIEPVFLEDLKAAISKRDLLAWAAVWKLTPGRFLKKLPPTQPDDLAVILFTSGSEKAPKAVPLSHQNLLSNQKAGIAFLKFEETDVFLGFLPAFHSFGLNVTSLFPMTLGIRVVHHPDPTDGANLAAKIKAYGVTTVLGTPTFVGMILDRSQPGDWTSVKLAVCGAEKLTDAIVAKFQAACPGGTILEGYGITECGPVVAVNPPAHPKKGSLGQPLPGTEVLITDLETGGPVEVGTMGMLLVRSPSVFSGYLGAEENPFVEIQGKSWYRTGDLCKLDAEGFLHFEGRLKRFIKVGGEMVSLPALEDVFLNQFPPTEEGPQVAIEGMDDHGHRLIVLFTRVEIDLPRANRMLQAEGFRGVCRLDAVKVVESIPVLGTGKTNYRELRALCQKMLINETLGPK